MISDFLNEDFYFSPSFSEDSFDPVLLCYAVAVIDDRSGFGLAILNRIFKKICPELSAVDFSDLSLDLEVLLETETQFYAALAICSIHYSTLSALLPKFAAAYMEDLHFTCEDFILYDFMDEYFETKHCLSQPAFNEMIDTLVLATLQFCRTLPQRCHGYEEPSGSGRCRHPDETYPLLCRCLRTAQQPL